MYGWHYLIMTINSNCNIWHMKSAFIVHIYSMINLSMPVIINDICWFHAKIRSYDLFSYLRCKEQSYFVCWIIQNRLHFVQLLFMIYSGWLGTKQYITVIKYLLKTRWDKRVNDPSDKPFDVFNIAEIIKSGLNLAGRMLALQKRHLINH